MNKTPDELKRPDPAYRLYTADFLVRNHSMTDEQVGKFIRILCYQHQNGHLPEAEMMAFCRGRDELVFSKFVKDDAGLYYNEEMDNEVIRRGGIRGGKAENANKRWSKEQVKPEDPDDLSFLDEQR